MVALLLALSVEYAGGNGFNGTAAYHEIRFWQHAGSWRLSWYSGAVIGKLMVDSGAAHQICPYATGATRSLRAAVGDHYWI